MARPKSEIPWLERRDNGKYYVHWYDAGAGRTRRLSLGTEDSGEAQARYAAFLSEGGDVIRGSKASGLTVRTALEQYKAEHVDQRCAAADRQGFAIARLVEYFDDFNLTDVDIPASRKYADFRRRGKRPAQNATIRRELGVLVAAGAHAVKWKRIPAESVPTVELPTVEKKAIEVFTTDEIKLIFAATEGYTKAFAILAYFTAARREAICDARVSQVDRKHNVLRLHREGVETAKRKATVPLNAACMEQIDMLEALSTDGRLFPASIDIYKRFRRVCEKKLGLGSRRNPHLLRHSRATHLLQDGKDIYLVAKLLGDTIDAVERNYGHSSPDFEARTATSWDDELL